jgi:hypothetical protein
MTPHDTARSTKTEMQNKQREIDRETEDKNHMLSC